MGCGPRKETKAPFRLGADSDGICERLSTAAVNPPLPLSTDAMTAQMPTSMISPWMKSFTAVAI